VRTERGFYRGRCVAEGLGFYPNRREVRGGHVQRVVFVLNSSEGMTGGSLLSAARGGELGTDSEKGVSGLWAVF
jgi:hypothetical protein